ncbi:MAG: hypothetical protein Q4C50_03870 [Eubacteriales bacterium]|nr:hypothetical protein [Eubacteriales bacterium]
MEYWLKGEETSMWKAFEDHYESGVRHGRSEGRNEGRNEGVKDGLATAKRVFALYRNGNSVTDIAKECSLTEEQVKNLVL